MYVMPKILHFMPIQVFIKGVSIEETSGVHEILTLLKAPTMQNTNCWHCNTITYGGGGGLKDPDHLWRPFWALILFWKFLTIPIHHFKTIKNVGKNFHFRGNFFLWSPGLDPPPPPHRSTLIRTPIGYMVKLVIFPYSHLFVLIQIQTLYHPLSIIDLYS